MTSEQTPINTVSSTSSGVVDAQWRPRYAGQMLPDELPKAPWSMVQQWFAEATEVVGQRGGEPGAVTLATVDADGMPDARMVLLKDVAARHFRFFSDAGSAKAAQLRATPQAALVLYWPQLHRQIRVRGHVVATPQDVADQYFASRPRGSQVAAAASNQSAEIASRQVLLDQVAAVEAAVGAGESVPTPASWVGFDVLPVQVELWAGDADRLHDRVRFVSISGDPVQMSTHSGWASSRVQP